ncbi:ATP-grasp domain-containing protein [Streptomyces sp. NPDC048417]|uniref:ATP-grasp domain-containing protein n=1 Tax=Streptomyces sp. NPDC048417 TaxID=3155387 RepID=UPI00341767F7
MIVNVFSIGSAPPNAIAEAAEPYGGCTFVVEPDDDAALASVPVLQELGEVVVADGVDACVRALGGRVPAGVVTFADRGLRLASGLARHYGLPGLSEKAAEWCCDKIAQRERLNACGVGDVPTAPLQGGVFPAEVPMPAVVKPREGAGSEDTAFVHSAEEFRDLMTQLSPDRPYVVERYIEGVDTPFGPLLTDSVSVESAVDARGAVRHIGMTLRLPLAPPARDTGLVFPVHRHSALTGTLLELAAAAIAAVDFTAGLTHIEFKLGPDGPVVIEVNGRLGGGLYRLMPRVGTVEPVGLATALAVGESLPDAFAEPTGHAMHYYAQPPYGAVAVSALPSPRTVRGVPGVFGADPRTRAGAPVHWRQGSAGRVYDIWIAADSLAELDQRRAAVDELLEQTTEWEYER